MSDRINVNSSFYFQLNNVDACFFYGLVILVLAYFQTKRQEGKSIWDFESKGYLLPRK